MGGGLESRSVGCVYGANGALRLALRSMVKRYGWEILSKAS